MARLPNEAIAAQREHPLTYASLILAALSPMVVGITALGMLLKRIYPSPSPFHIAAGACAFILLIPALMCLGAYGWLLLARRIVPRSIAQAFFVHPGIGVLSLISEWMFVRVYGAVGGPPNNVTVG